MLIARLSTNEGHVTRQPLSLLYLTTANSRTVREF
jgi:hypothetical protein